jgi:hypothetical protein
VVAANDFLLEDIDTDIESLMTEPGILRMIIQVIGEFQNLRELLLDLGSLPYLEHIEVIQISSLGTKNKINLTIWISQDQ